MLSRQIWGGLAAALAWRADRDKTWTARHCRLVLANLIVAQEASSRTAGMAEKTASEVAGTTMDCVWQHGRPCRP